MALLPILTAPDRRLKQKSAPVDRVDQAIRRLMDDMLATMYAAPGIGLAAPQVGVLKQVIVVDVGLEQDQQRPVPLLLANPRIVQMEGELTWKEGCLSVPDQSAEVLRAAVIDVHALDQDNRPVRIEATGLLAVCLQHEIDHLHGTLFIDRLSRLKRAIILQKLKKAAEGKERE
ncbi:MAG: peptide deformylase [Magnetococcus sp. DMHC-8]